ncbi:secreted LysM effector LysM2 [Elaeis guineensis]|uniref:Uncharacterized protein LOC109504781 n=1 Tax=Elaeis guineensis var. tenera TaxID=51953 RepID=A0A6J0PMV4_ELAGV|nr:uncharacterized protein LOC109504781 [Elaeis guineensis]
MVKANKKVAAFVNGALLVSLLLLFAINMAEGKLFGVGYLKSTLRCETVYGVQSGNTCFKVQQQFNLTAEEFGGINPNLDCDNLFVGQWLCVNGTA